MKDLHNLLNNVSPVQENTWNEVKGLFTAQSLKKGEYFIKGYFSIEIWKTCIDLSNLKSA